MRPAGQGCKKPGFKKNPTQCFLCGVFWVICPAERVFRVFLVSKMLYVHPDFKLLSLLLINLFLLIYASALD